MASLSTSDGNVWVTDGLGRNGKGHQVFKFSPEGKLLLTLGKAGQPGSGPDEFNAPSAVVTAPNGDIFVADGHGGNTNARIVKFDHDGKFIKTWGHKGSAPGELDIPHAIAMDFGWSAVRRRPAEQPHPDFRSGRQVHRPVDAVQPAERHLYRQERCDLRGRPPNRNPSRRITTAGSAASASGSAKDGAVTAFIPDPVERSNTTSAAEGVAADAAGNIYGAEVGLKRMMKYVRK